ncbi:carboxymuconolactone decarboxylase family protein [Sphingomonas jatrophae]|uniref:4-carboxymuconolactone decarboxylase n=1 Tax=Sphingomonas jatrophae TaxID=1166337 RepID=A0A1I6KG13_9SPHN|nr:carboxymuconolactone decarboxylase family protein [Sphingomonas jatrophae]SFR90126.1 4-carboxymuconolactone decarboxylase [Sphingomonas jatrophae]
MTDDSRRTRGEAMFGQVYGGVVPLPAAETRDDYVHTVIDHLFGTVWPRDGLPVRDRRLVILGVAIAQGEDAIVEIQLRAALANGELSLADIDEILVLMPYYVGYPRAGHLQAIVRRLRDEAT